MPALLPAEHAGEPECSGDAYEEGKMMKEGEAQIAIHGEVRYDPELSMMGYNIDLWRRGFAAYRALPWRTRFLMFLREDPADEEQWVNPGPPPEKTYDWTEGEGLVEVVGE